MWLLQIGVTRGPSAEKFIVEEAGPVIDTGAERLKEYKELNGPSLKYTRL